MAKEEKAPSSWDIRLVAILFDIGENEIPKSLKENGKCTKTQEVVERAIQIAEREKTITRRQLDILEQVVGRYGPRKTLKKIAEEKGVTSGNIAAQKKHALQNLSASPLLQKLIHSPFEPCF